MTNPITILFFAGIFAGLGTGTGGSYASAAVLVAGVLAGSALWWFTLSGLVSLFRTRFNARALRWVNGLSGLVIVGFGLAALYSLKG